MKTLLDIPRYLEICWPNLELDNHKETSPQDGKYNCIAWAVGKNDERWAPYTGHTWFKGFHKFSLANPPDEDLDSYKEGFASVGYEECLNGNLEKGFEKIALYVKGKIVKHIARQLEDGSWTSKLGDFQDISHTTLSVLEGISYGDATIFMKRKKKNIINQTMNWFSELLRD